MPQSFSILRQADFAQVETRVAVQYAITRDIPIRAVRLEALEHHAESLRDRSTLPIGSVEFIRKAMAIAGITEPDNLSYPDALRSFLEREVRLAALDEIRGRCFIKPMVTKIFTGFVFDESCALADLDDHDREQLEVMSSLSSQTMVWVSDAVQWLNEYRYYILEGRIVGEARYDDADDELTAPNRSVVDEMVRMFASSNQGPVAFSLDVGVMSNGKTALIECNDAWALGYYKGTISPKHYLEMLWRRWEQMSITAAAHQR